MSEPVTYTASVKVMRSHDYCHFEIMLGTTEPIDLAGVDAMRKEAARLADKAVEQYKIAKSNAAKLLQDRQQRGYLADRVAHTRELPESERTVAQQAELKAYDDEAYRESRAYGYQDEWEDSGDDYF